MKYIIGTPEFIQRADEWLSKNTQSSALWIYNNKSKIPPMFISYTEPFLYRGMKVVPDFLNKDSNILSNFSSWSKSEKIAKGFVTDTKYSIYSNKKSDKIPILIKKKISAQAIVFNFHSFALFMGEPQLEMLGMDELSYENAINEMEVLIKNNLKITKKDYKVIQ